MNRLTTFIVAVLLLGMGIAAYAQYPSGFAEIHSSGAGGSGGGGGPVTLTGVVTGPSGANVFNSTNTAGNTMNNAFTIDNSSGNGNPALPVSADLLLEDATNTGEFLGFFGDFSGSGGGYPYGFVESFPGSVSDPTQGQEIDFGTVDTNGAGKTVGWECDSVNYTGTSSQGNSHPGSCEIAWPFYLNTTNATLNFQGNGTNAGVNQLAASNSTTSSLYTVTMPNLTGAMSFLPTIYSAAGTAIPAAAAANNHLRACVSDSTACTNGTTYASGGTTPCELWSNGTNWKESGSGC